MRHVRGSDEAAAGCSARRWTDLPDAARRYIARLEEVSGVQAAIVSTGSERDDTIIRDDVMEKSGLRL